MKLKMNNKGFSLVEVAVAGGLLEDFPLYLNLPDCVLEAG
jgi:hypothetical protein